VGAAAANIRRSELSTYMDIILACTELVVAASSDAGIFSATRSKSSPLKRRATATHSSSMDCYLSETLKDPCGAHPSANAHGNHAVARVAALQLAQNRRRKLCAGAPERMPESDRASVGIHARRIEPGLLDHCERLHGERFVKFDHVDLIEVQASQLQDLRNRVGRANAHDFGGHSGGGEAEKTRQRLYAQRSGALGTHHDACGRAVTGLRAVPRSSRAARMKRGFELRQGFERGIGARAFVRVKYSCGRFGLCGFG